MQEFIMTIGLPSVGKTTWAKAQQDEQYYWLSSDAIRNATGISNDKVFASMARTTKAMLQLGKSVIYDATNLWRRHRMATLQQLKEFAPNVYFRAEVFLAPIDVLYERNAKREDSERVPDDVMQKFLCGFQFPQKFEGWDEININRSSIHQLFNFGKCDGYDQKTPYHELTLDKHLWKTVEEAKVHHYNNVMQTAALYHDVGKIYCQTFKDGIAHYYGHENISAYLYAMHEYTQNIFSWNDFLDILFIINYHMRPYQWTEKSYQKDLELFGERRVELLKQFHYCDEAAH